MASKSLGYDITATDRASETFVKMAVQVERLAKRLDALDGKRARVTVDADTAGAHRKIQTLDKSFGAATIRIAALGRAMGALALPGAIVAATPAIASLGSSAVTASGALWLLPAAATAGGIAMAALKVGTAGFGEAMKNMGDPAKFAEAIAKLSPAARDAATTIRSLVPAWTAMQQVVQQNLFAGVAAQIGALAGIYLPMLTTGLGSVAGSLNAAGIGLANWARQGAVIGSIQTIFTNVGLAMQALAPTAAHIAAIFTDIAMVGSGFLPGLATGFTGATASAAAFIAQARQTGQLAVWIQNGLAVLRQLGELTGNVGSILGSVFGAAARSGESFLSMLVRVTGTMAAALKTPEGAAGLQEFFTTTRMVVGLLWDKLVQLWPVVVAGGSAFGALLQAAAPLSDVVFGLVVAGLVPLLDVVKFLAPVLGPLAVVLGVIRVAVMAWTAAQWLLNVALSLNPLGIVVIAIAALVAALILAWNHSETFRVIVIAAWTAIKVAAVAVFGVVLNFITTVWNTIKTVAITVWGFISAYFAGAFAAFSAIFSAVWNGIVAVFSFVWNTIKTIALTVWGGIVTALGSAFNIFRVAFIVFWGAIAGAFLIAWDTIRSTAIIVWNAISTFFTGAFAVFRAVFTAVWNAISAVFSAVWNFIRNTAITVWNAIVAFFMPAFVAFQAFFSTVWNAIVAFFVGTWNNLRTTAVNAWNVISGFFTAAFAVFSKFFGDTWNGIVGTFDRIWSGIVSIAQRVWAAVRGAFVHGINVIIRVINGFAGAINRVASLLGFNINLGIPEVRADGGQIEAIRRALGGPISADVIPRAAGGGVNAAAGGRLPATGTMRDTLPALAGGQRYLLQGKEWIIRSGASAALGADKMAMINQADRRPVDVVPRGVMERVAHYAQGGPIPMASAGEIARAASALVPGSRMSSGYRRGDPGMHGRNQAADMTGNLGAINRAWAQRYGPSTDQLIYTPGINLLNGRGHTYNAGTRADHYDHVHIGYSGQLGLPGGGFFDPSEGGRLAQLIRPIVDGLLNPLRDRLRPIRDNQAEGLGNRMVAGVGLKLLDHLFAKADEKDAANARAGGMDVSGITGPVVEQVRQVAHRYGWGAGPQWDALARLIQKESGWNPNAANPRSSARGLFQKMTSLHGPVEPTAAGQAAWGLNYIQRTYRDPIGALNFHNRRGWYDRGGVASGRGLMWKETIRPERVLDPDMTRTFDRFTDWLGSTTARQLLSTQTAGRRGGVTVNVDSPALVAELAKLRADVKALQGGGATIHVEDRSGNPTETARAAQLALRLAR